MPSYFYHYTSETAYKAIYKGTADWSCESCQPQKQNWYGDQNAKGFYVDPLAANDLNATTARKSGDGVAGATYVFIFRFEGKEKDLKKKTSVHLLRKRPPSNGKVHRENSRSTNWAAAVAT